MQGQEGSRLYCIRIEWGLKGVLALLCLKGFEKSCPDSTLHVVTFLVLVPFKAESPLVAVKSRGTGTLWQRCWGRLCWAWYYAIFRNRN